MRLPREEFLRLVQEAFQELPAMISSSLENVAILVEDWPSIGTLEEAGIDSREHLFGLYHGVPLPERGGEYPLLPDTITLYQRPIESACSSPKEMVREIRVTLLHEVGHYLGMAEEELESLGYG